MESIHQLWTEMQHLIINYVPRLIYALLTLIIGFYAIKIFMKYIRKVFQRTRMEVSLQKFLDSLLSVILKIVLVLTFASMLGIEATSIVAMLGAMALAVGLALQGSLANFAGGVLILMFKPFKINDVIEAQGVIGRVDAIQVFNTVIKTADNKTIFIPNGALANGNITNFTMEGNRRVDMMFGIGYGDDITRAKEVLAQVVARDERILPDPATQIVVHTLGDSSVNIAVRVWCAAGEFWNVFFDLQEKVKMAFDAEGISIPFPQHDVHIIQK